MLRDASAEHGLLLLSLFRVGTLGIFGVEPLLVLAERECLLHLGVVAEPARGVLHVELARGGRHLLVDIHGLVLRGWRLPTQREVRGLVQAGSLLNVHCGEVTRTIVDPALELRLRRMDSLQARGRLQSVGLERSHDTLPSVLGGNGTHDTLDPGELDLRVGPSLSDLRRILLVELVVVLGRVHRRILLSIQAELQVLTGARCVHRVHPGGSFEVSARVGRIQLQGRNLDVGGLVSGSVRRHHRLVDASEIGRLLLGDPERLLRLRLPVSLARHSRRGHPRLLAHVLLLAEDRAVVHAAGQLSISQSLLLQGQVGRLRRRLLRGALLEHLEQGLGLLDAVFVGVRALGRSIQGVVVGSRRVLVVHSLVEQHQVVARIGAPLELLRGVHTVSLSSLELLLRRPRKRSPVSLRATARLCGLIQQVVLGGVAEEILRHVILILVDIGVVDVELLEDLCQEIHGLVLRNHVQTQLGILVSGPWSVDVADVVVDEVVGLGLVLIAVLLLHVLVVILSLLLLEAVLYSEIIILLVGLDVDLLFFLTSFDRVKVHEALLVDLCAVSIDLRVVASRKELEEGFLMIQQLSQVGRKVLYFIEEVHRILGKHIQQVLVLVDVLQKSIDLVLRQLPSIVSPRCLKLFSKLLVHEFEPVYFIGFTQLFSAVVKFHN